MPRAVHASGRVWAVARDGSLRHADASTTPDWEEAATLPSPVVTLASCDDRVSVFAACRDGSLHLFHAHNGSLILSGPAPLHNVPLCILPLPLENALFVGLQDGAVVRCHLASLAFDCMLGCGVEHKEAVNALDADDLYLYSGGEDAVVLVWDLKEATAVREISMPSAPVRSLLRVDFALWTGLANGSVQVFDIFGDDTNGIERIADKTPHAGPVTDLVKIGEAEVWSLAGVPDHADISLDEAPSLAVWDTRDLSFAITDSLRERDLMSVAVVDRMAFEEVTVLAITNTLESQFVSKTVKGSLAPAVSEEGSENYHSLVSDLDDPLVQASPSYRRAAEDEQTGTGMPSLFISSPGAGPYSEYPLNEGVDDRGDTSQIQRNGSFNLSPASLEKEEHPFTLPRSTSETLLTSLRRISELLVTLLTDDVLSPDEGHTRGSSQELRASVATITRELNVGRQLVESSAVTNNSDNTLITVDENDLTRNIGNHKSSCCESAILPFRKRLDKEVASKGKLDRDLALVTTERDIVADEHDQLKLQSETTMSSFQGIIRDANAEVAKKDALIDELRNECKLTEAKYQNEVNHRELQERKYGEHVNDLAGHLGKASKECEQELKTVYDKMERKDIEIQAQQDSIRGLNAKIDSLLTTEKSLRRKCGSLEDKTSEQNVQIQEAEKYLKATSIQAEEFHRNQLSTIRKEHECQIRAVRSQHDRVVEAMESRVNEYERDKHKEQMDLEKLSNELEEIRRDLDAANARVRTLEGLHQEKSSEIKTQANRDIERLGNDVAALKQCLIEAKEQTDVELKICQEKYFCQIQEKDAKIDSLRSSIAELHEGADDTPPSPDQIGGVVQLLKKEISSLQEELRHRKAAAELYEQETQAVNMAASNFRAAADDLQIALRSAENDIASMKEQLEGTREVIAGKDAYIEQLERHQGRQEGGLASVATGVGSNNMATQALLASANGEIEQMNNQLESMHFGQVQQERELAELRMALASAGQSDKSGIETTGGLLRKNCSSENENMDAILSAEIPNLQTILGKGASPSTDPTLHAMGGTRDSPNRLAVEDILVNDALQEVQDGMTVTQSKLRDLSDTARKYRKCAQSHLDILPALYELEAELVRVSQEDTKKASRLKSSRGIVQSVIAQYYSSSEKRAVLRDYDASRYAPSANRLEALHRAVVEMRGLRTGSQEAPDVPSVDSVPQLGETRSFQDQSCRDEVSTPRRLLTY